MCVCLMYFVYIIRFAILIFLFHLSHFKVYSSLALTASTVLSDHHHYLVQSSYIIPNGNSVAIKQ